MHGRKYTDEFKEMVVELHKTGKPPCETMREYGLNSSVYYAWVNNKKTVTVDDQKFTAKEVKDLKRENSKLKMELEILKKALALFAER